MERFITPDEARKRAERYFAKHVAKRMFEGAKVLDGADASRLMIRLPGSLTPKDIWVVYENLSNVLALRSSNIIAVCKRSGRVVYEGSAGDEG